MMKFKFIALVLLLVLLMPQFAETQASTPASKPATIVQLNGNYSLRNEFISVQAVRQDAYLTIIIFRNHADVGTMVFTKPFAILMKDGTIYDRTNLLIKGDIVTRELQPNPAAPRLADRTHGVALDIPLVSTDGQLHATWSLILLDGTSYFRHSLTINALDKDLPIQQVRLLDVEPVEAKVVGSVPGSPIVDHNLIYGFEDPLSISKVRDGRATEWIERELPLHAGQQVTYSAVIIHADYSSLRRSFLAYIENERAHPYRTFLHYNSWYDLGYFTPYTEKDALDRIDTFGRELVEKRGVKLDSFLFDDGWDNHHTLWGFNDGFPNGFQTLKAEAQKFGAAPGVWMSPWGGYSEPKAERITFGRANNYEIVNDGYALSGPKYYDAFRDVAMNMVKQYGVNQFKFDGTGNVDSVFKGSRFDSDFAAMQHLIGELRAAKPDLFVNLTTGTWPSPFWLMYADSIWRGGEDDSTAGVGPYRERWITYRDADTYKRVVLDGPLYPLNSLMLHGLIFAQHHRELKEDPQNSFQHEVRSYFGTGTQLQEMYITPSLLSNENWNDLAEAANWSRNNADVLKDSHWIGGNPAWLEVYGWAAWSPKKSIITLRNPSDHEQKFILNLRTALELPQNAPTEYYAHSPWANYIETKSDIAIDADKPYEFRLQPFEVRTLDIRPQ